MKRDIDSCIYQHGKDIIESETFQSMENFMQHGNVSVCQHSISVALESIKFVRKFKISCDERAVVRGALLHDYFLYDWHEKALWHNWHGFRHPGIALQNAVKEYSISQIEGEIIKKHMWPLTIIPPLCREAWIITLVDKYVSTLETVGIRKASDMQKIPAGH